MWKYVILMAVLVTACNPAHTQEAETNATAGSIETTATQNDVWLTDFEAAKRKAAEKSVPILVDFSGSDWCGWCKKLDREVFSKEAFGNYAKDNLVLFIADFPRRKQLPEDEVRQNQALMKEFGIRGFPTIVLLDANGKELARTGYRPGGPEAYVDHLKQLLQSSRKDASASPVPEAG